MKPEDLKRQKITEELVVAPPAYQGLPDLSDDYDFTAMLMTKDGRVLQLGLDGLNAEEDYVYGPKTSYKGKYTYNRDD